MATSRALLSIPANTWYVAKLSDTWVPPAVLPAPIFILRFEEPRTRFKNLSEDFYPERVSESNGWDCRIRNHESRIKNKKPLGERFFALILFWPSFNLILRHATQRVLRKI